MIAAARLPVFVVCLTVVAVLTAACREDPQDASVGDAAAACRAGGRPLPLEDTFHELRSCFEQRSYLALRPYIDPAGRDNVLATLVTMDELMAANAAALEAIREHYPQADTKDFDLSYFNKDLELFSENLEFVRAVETGGTGIIYADNPIYEKPVRLKFAKRGDRWVYVPDYPEVADMIVKLTKSLNRLTWMIRREEWTFEQMCDDYYWRIRKKWPRLVEQAVAQNESS